MAIYLGIVNSGLFVTADNYVLVDSNNLKLNASAETSKWKIMINGIKYRINEKERD